MLNENLIKGQIIELKVQEELLRYGFDISVPNYNASKYDLIADTDKELLKIQVKKAIANSNSSFTFSCTTQNVKASSKAKHKYTSNEIDYFATAWRDKVYLVPVDETSQTKTIKFDDDQYLASNVLASYKRLDDDALYNYSSKGHGKTYCEDCGCEISRGATKCLSCLNREKSSHIPNREELKCLIRTTPFTKIGKQFGVTDNAVRKWCDKYNLPRRSGDIKKYTEVEWESL